MAAAQQQPPPLQQNEAATPGGIEVDLRWYVTGLGVIMAISFMAGLQQSPFSLVDHETSANTLMAPTAHGTSSPAMPPASDRSKIVRDSFLVQQQPQPEDSIGGSNAEMLYQSLDGEDDDEDAFDDQAYLTFDPTAAAAGEHLLVDIEGVDADFLDSESRLAQAMIDTTKEAGLELLSYHCHSLEPKGVSCVGVLLESHMSFHTWPDEGVITLDLYVTTVSTNTEQQAKQQPLVPNVVESVKRLFGVRGAGKAPRPLNARWSHEFRGFDPAASQANYGIHLAGSDLALWVLSPLEMYSKTLVHSSWTQSNQRVDIWDLVEVTDTPSQADVIKYGLKEGDPRLYTPELVTPWRVVFLNGKLTVMVDEEEVLMETLVHPALFAHRRPEQVTVLAGYAGLTNGVIREILKHKTVEKVTAWQTNAELVFDIASNHLKTLNNCTLLIGRADNCLEDPIVDLKYYHEQPLHTVITADSPKQDAMIILDYASFMKSADDVSKMFQLWMDSLTSEGVLLIELGQAAAIHDPRPDLGVHARREEMMLALDALDDVGAMLVFEEAHTGALEPDGFLLVCKHASCRQRWYARSDQVEFQIYDRLVKTIKEYEKGMRKPVLAYYDGTTQRSYQWPKKGWETVYCKREPTPWECAYIHLNQYAEFHEFNVTHENEGSFRMEIKYDRPEDDEDAEIEETRVFATTNIPKGSYIMAEHLANSLMVTSRNLEGLVNNTKMGSPEPKGKVDTPKSRATIIEDLLEFIDDHGHASIMEGSEQFYVEVGGSALIRRSEKMEEANIEPWVPRRRSPKPKYSPVYERHRMSFDVFIVASRDIKKGDEIVMYKDMWTAPTVD
ncbi:hypothetical protein ACA910_007233 [Epithemia clementina (nom. ined.)]